MQTTDKGLKALAKKVLDLIGINAKVRHTIKKLLGLDRVFYYLINVNGTHYKKRCLFVYITYPFIKNFNNSHQNQWQAVEMARVIGTFGYDVDVLNYQCPFMRDSIKYKYDLIIDIIPRKNFWANQMNEGCINVSYMTGMSVNYAYTAEHQRLSELKQRRGVKLSPRRTQDLDIANEKNIEEYDFVWYIGNSYNVHSFDQFKMPPICFIRNNGYVFDWADTVTTRNKHNFLFFASSGQVHKGLDLLLEIFAQEKYKYNLYICSPFMREEDFCKEYEQELFHRPNIFPIGWVNIESQQFRDVTSSCAYVLMPSCSEGCAGSILTVMSAGVIPIVSRICGLDDDDVIGLPDCTISTIERYINEYATKPDEWVHERSQKCLDTIRTKYSPENFSQSVRDAMTITINQSKNMYLVDKTQKGL